MKRVYLCVLTALILSGCKKKDATDPTNNSSTTTTSQKFSCKINGVDFNADTAYATFSTGTGFTLVDIYALKFSGDKSYIEETVNLSLRAPTYTGIGTYELAVDTVDIFGLSPSISYAWATSTINITTYVMLNCYKDPEPSLGSNGTIVLTQADQEGVFTGTFNGSACRLDSLITITDGVFNDVYIYK